MINHVTITTGNLNRLKHFYDSALEPLGIRRLYEGEGYYGYGVTEPYFWISEGDEGSRVHIAFDAKNEDQVKAFHLSAIAAGGKDNGGAGLRPEYRETYYAAFVFDPDGNNIEAVFGNE